MSRPPSCKQRSPHRGDPTKPLYRRGLLAGLVVVVGGGLAAWLFMGERGETGEKGERVEVKPSQIAEVAPAVVTNVVEEVVVEKPKKTRPTKIGETVNGYIMRRDGTIRRREHVITNSAASRPKGWYEIFPRHSDNEIARYLAIEPGTQLLGDRTYNGRFRKEFEASLSEPIEITPDDTPEEAQLKSDVLAARQQLKEAMDRGEDIEQIMIDTRAELQELGRVKQEFHKLFLRERRKCETDEDVQDLLGACNKFLEEKGIAPLTCTPITRRNILRGERDRK